jgi:hypothetical protein
MNIYGLKNHNLLVEEIQQVLDSSFSCWKIKRITHSQDMGEE